MWLPLKHPLLGTWPTTQPCAPTENLTSGPLVPRQALNPLSHTSWGSALYVLTYGVTVYYLSHSCILSFTKTYQLFLWIIFHISYFAFLLPHPHLRPLPLTSGILSITSPSLLLIFYLSHVHTLILTYHHWLICLKFYFILLHTCEKCWVVHQYL